MDGTVVYRVPDMSCEHCRAAISRELEAIAGVADVEVDLAGKVVSVTGHGLDDAALRAAIEEAGYEAERLEPGSDPSAEAAR
jgi:copper chaperone CopZ